MSTSLKATNKDPLDLTVRELIALAHNGDNFSTAIFATPEYTMVAVAQGHAVNHLLNALSCHGMVDVPEMDRVAAQGVGQRGVA